MYKLLFCLRRRSDLTREEFLTHWHGPHADLGRAGASAIGAVRYVQNHTVDHPMNDALRESRGAPEPFDGVVELWFESLDAVGTTFTDREARRAIAALVADEPNFIDLDRSPIFVTEAKPMWDFTR
ncbi:EthD domain-containing protein [Aeromicrobium wangtongii]|uniref:EthD domain-containing protein n=1 Tax=Aeromicrobium wangtongii TaxID=2969247 RepID=UPI002017B43C|nr:EthD domain-containing protein [Aeromicrobium wangtongii]MCL3819852.1 EthD domain-containing protein [Aeromicrobium wangtongii]